MTAQHTAQHMARRFDGHAARLFLLLTGRLRRDVARSRAVTP